MKEVVVFLSKIKNESPVLTVPAKLSYILSFYSENPSVRFFHMFVNQGKSGFNYMLEDLKIYNWPNADVQYWRKKYAVRYFILAKNHLVQAAKREINYQFPETRIVLDNAEFVIYEVGNSQ
jgi:hypothetical protein